MLSPRTEQDYRYLVARWARLGRPEPKAWVLSHPSEARRRNTRAALVWWYYASLSERNPTAFSEPLTYVDALYLSLSTFTTTGFGDISASSELARALVAGQMMVGFGLLTFGFGAALSRMWSALARGANDG